jgi:hypothetical protein
LFCFPLAIRLNQTFSQQKIQARKLNEIGNNRNIHKLNKKGKHKRKLNKLITKEKLRIKKYKESQNYKESSIILGRNKHKKNNFAKQKGWLRVKKMGIKYGCHDSFVTFLIFFDGLLNSACLELK